MPTGPKGQKRPADAIARAVKVARIAIGEDADQAPDDGKDPAAKALGRRAGAGGMISTVRRCEHCAAILPPMAHCDGEALPEESLAQIAMEPVEFAGDDGRKRRGVIPRVCLERYRDEDGRVRFPEIAA